MLPTVGSKGKSCFLYTNSINSLKTLKFHILRYYNHYSYEAKTIDTF